MDSEKKIFIPQQYDRYVIAIASLLVGVLLTIGGYALFQKSSSVIDYGTVLNTVAQTTIGNIVMAKGVDASANALNTASQFSSKSDKSIYMVLSLKNAKTTDKLTYTRFFNGNYIDSEQASPSKDGVMQFYFNWNKTGTLNYPTGNYLIKVYLNGVLSDAVSYSVI